VRVGGKPAIEEARRAQAGREKFDKRW
jgi:hypothetical protein